MPPVILSGLLSEARRRHSGSGASATSADLWMTDRKRTKGPRLRSENLEPEGSGGGGEHCVMRGHDEALPGSLLPEKGGREMNRIQRPERGRKRLSGPRKDGLVHLDDLHPFQQPIHRLTAARDLGITDPCQQAKTVESAKTLDLRQRAPHSGVDRLPLLEGAGLPQDHPEQDGRVEVGDQRSRRRSSSSNATM